MYMAGKPIAPAKAPPALRSVPAEQRQPTRIRDPLEEGDDETTKGGGK
jgi:hypothetical protein